MIEPEGAEQAQKAPPLSAGAATSPTPFTFARNAAATSLAHGALFVLSFVISVLAARILGPEGKGVYALVLLFASLFVFFSSFGLHYAAAFFLGRKEYPQKEVFGQAVLSLLAVIAVAVVAAVGTRPWLAATVFPGVAPRLLALSIPLIVGQHAFGFLALVLLGRDDIAGYSFVQIARPALLLLIAAPVLLAGAGVAGILGAEAAAFLVAGGIAFILALRGIRGLSVRFNPRYAGAALRYGLMVYSGHALSFFHYRTALMLLGALSTPAVVGLYSVAAGVAGNLSLISQGAATALFPRISSDTGGAETRELTPLVLRTVVAATGAAAVGLALTGRWLVVTIFGDAFAGAVGPLRILLPGAVALCAWSILDSYFKGAGRPIWSTVTTGLAVAAGAALTIWWIPVYGLAGAAAATSLAYVLSLLVALAAYARISGIPLAAALRPRREDITLYRGFLARLLRPRVARAPAAQEVTSQTRS